MDTALVTGDVEARSTLKLREKLEDDPNAPKLIKTVWGTGYILEV